VEPLPSSESTYPLSVCTVVCVGESVVTYWHILTSHKINGQSLMSVNK